MVLPVLTIPKKRKKLNWKPWFEPSYFATWNVDGHLMIGALKPSFVSVVRTHHGIISWFFETTLKEQQNQASSHFFLVRITSQGRCFQPDLWSAIHLRCAQSCASCSVDPGPKFQGSEQGIAAELLESHQEFADDFTVCSEGKKTDLRT